MRKKCKLNSKIRIQKVILTIRYVISMITHIHTYIIMQFLYKTFVHNLLLFGIEINLYIYANQ